MEGEMRKGLNQLFAAFAITTLCVTSVNLAPISAAQAASPVIKLNYTKKSMNIGDKLTLKATITKKTLKSKKLVWKSNKASIASITQKGVIKAKKEGAAKITVTIKGTDHKATCSINVQDTKKADEEILFTVQTSVRLVGDADKSWKKEVDAKIGDKVEFQIEYKNTSKIKHEDVVIRDILPSNLKFVGGTTLYNTNHPKGMTMDNPEHVVGTGLFIGSYNAGANAFVRFTAEVVNDNFTCGDFVLHNWGRASVAGRLVQDSAAVKVALASCPDPETPPTPVDPEKPTEPTTPTNPTTPGTPSELPSTGPVAVAGSVIGIGSIVTAAGYYIASRRALR